MSWQIFYIIFFLLLLVSCNTKKSGEMLANSAATQPVIDLEFAEVKPDLPLSKEDIFHLEKTSIQIIKALKNTDLNLLRKFSLNTIYCQACKYYPGGTLVEVVPVREMSLKNFLHFYRDSFFLSKKLKNVSLTHQQSFISHFNIKKPNSFSLATKDSISIYKVQFFSRKEKYTQWSLNYYFIKENKSFKFFGLYL